MQDMTVTESGGRPAIRDGEAPGLEAALEEVGYSQPFRFPRGSFLNTRSQAVVFPASAGSWVEVDEERLLVCRVGELLGVLDEVAGQAPAGDASDARAS